MIRIKNTLQYLFFFIIVFFLSRQDLAAQCTPPAQPGYGSNLWNVHVYNGTTYDMADFRGYYIVGDSAVTVPPGGNVEDFEFNTCTHGWYQGNDPCFTPDDDPSTFSQAALGTPSNAPSYIGCDANLNTPGPNAIWAKREGFPCGLYAIELYQYDDNFRMQIDQEGDGILELDITFDNTQCCWQNADSYGTIWLGYLGANSKVDIRLSNDELGGENYFYGQVIFDFADQLANITTMTQPISTTGASDGEIEICVSESVPPYSVAIDPAVGNVQPTTGDCVGNFIATGLTIGAYTVIVTDALGCTSTVSTTITDEPCTGFEIASAQGTPETCLGANDGTVQLTLNDVGDATELTISIGNGVPPVTFDNLNTSNPLIVENVPPGIYDLVVTDNNGCQVAYLFNPVSVTEGDFLQVDASVTGTSDVNLDDGIIDVCINDTPGDYVVSVSPSAGIIINTGGTTECAASYQIIDVPAGPYTVLVESQSGCIDSIPVIVNTPECPIQVDIDTVFNNCGNEAGGGFTMTVTGAVPPLNISLDDGVTFETINTNVFTQDNLNGGTYQAYIIDDEGCEYYTSLIVIEENLPITNDGAITHTTSFGGSNGSIEMCINGGISPYQVNVSPNFGTLTQNASSSDCEDSYTLSSLPAGIYTITVIDDIGCESDFDFEVLEPSCANFNLNDITVDSVVCFGDNNGVITVTTTGGVGPYTYQVEGLKPIAGVVSNSYSFSGLDTGFYEIFIIDESTGCTIPVPSPIQVLQNDRLGTVATVIPSCPELNNGVLCLTPLGGISPYTYRVELDGDPVTVITGPSPECGGEFYAENLEAGTYFVELQDAAGCLAHGLVEVPETQVEASFLTTPDCTGVDVGAIDLAPTGGTAPYTFDWSNGDTTEDIANLSEGTYTVTITGSRGCTGTAVVPVELSDISVNFTTSPTCDEQAAGNIFTSLSNGISPYTFNWSNGATTQDNLGLNVGNYSVTITDDRGCVENTSTSIGSYEVNLNLTPTSTCDNQDNGTVDVTTTSGFAPFDYNWSNGASGEDLSSLAPNTYTVTATDVNGCTAVVSTIVEEYIVTADVLTTGTCDGQNSGILEADVSNASGTISFAWSNGAVTQTVNGVGDGDYTVTITDALGCTAIGSGNVPLFPEVMVVASPDQVIEQGEFVQIDADATGGDGNYTYQWTPLVAIDNPAAQSPFVNPTSTTTYTVFVIDGNGCSDIDQVLVEVIPPVIIAMPNAFSPNDDGDNDIFEAFIPNADANVTAFQVFNRWGQNVHDDPSVGWDGNFNGTQQPVGTYVYVLEYEDLLGRQKILKGHVNLIR